MNDPRRRKVPGLTAAFRNGLTSPPLDEAAPRSNRESGAEQVAELGQTPGQVISSRARAGITSYGKHELCYDRFFAKLRFAMAQYHFKRLMQTSGHDVRRVIMRSLDMK